MMKSLGRLRLITFDVTDTLLQFRSSPGKQYGEAGALFGVRCDNNDLVRNFRANWHKQNRTYPNFGRNSRMEWQHWWRELIANTFEDSGAKVPAEKLENFASHLVELYKTSICWQHCNGSIDLLNYLRKQQHLGSLKRDRSTANDDDYVANETSNDHLPPFELGIIANFDPRLDGLLQNMKISHYFEFALNSYDCKVEKPNVEIFEMAMRAADLPNLRPEECLHIGDGPTTDYLGAKAVGWNAALIHAKSAAYLINKYGPKIDERFVFPSLYDFHKKLASNAIDWLVN